MTISINRNPGDRLLELGGGSRPLVKPECQGGRDVHVDCRMAHDAEGKQTVDITWDLGQTPWPLKDEEFDGVIAVFVLEHVPYPAVPDFIKELFRVLKPDSKAVVAVPDTSAQLRWTLEHPEGWDNKDLFLAASEKLFGDQRHSEREGEALPGSDSHKSFFSPAIVTQLFQEAGFSPIVVRPYGERATDLLVEAVKKAPPPGNPPKTLQDGRSGENGDGEPYSPPEGRSPRLDDARGLETEGKGEVRNLEALYGRDYWENYRGEGFAWDFPRHEIIFRHIMRRKPESVLELGCGRGYLLKRFQDAGIRTIGLDVSRNAWQTRVTEGVYLLDVLKTPWENVQGEQWKDGITDLCLSAAFLEHVPEHLVPLVVEEMRRTCKRGLHAVHFSDDGKQQGACTFRPREWWQDRLPPGHEVASWDEMVQGEFPPDVLKGDGKVKANLGCAWTMRHHGWENVDVLDLKQFAGANGYKFRQWDLKQGLPWKTGEVDLFFCVKPGALVRTKRGMIPIENVRVGDMVLTHLCRWRKVVRTFRRDVEDELMTEFHGACRPFSLTGNHEVFVQRSRKDCHRTCHYDRPRQWIPANLTETNDRILVPFPPMDIPIDRFDLSTFVDQAGSKVVHEVIAARKAGQTYDSICGQFDITKMMVRKWTSGQSVPRGVFFVSDAIIRRGGSARWNTVPRYVDVSEDFGRLLGYLISDGSASEGGQIGFSFGKDQKEYADDAVRLMQKIFDALSPQRHCLNEAGTMWAVRFCCGPLGGILKKLMHSKKGMPGRKRIDRRLLRGGNPEFFKGLITGLWRGDGSLCKSAGRYSTVSAGLAYQVQEVLYRLGIASRISRARSLKEYIGPQGEIIPAGWRNYEILVSGESYRALRKLLNVDAVPALREIRSRSFVSDSGIEMAVKVRSYRYDGPVYDLSVEEDHSYTVNGVAVHNCSHVLEHLNYADGLRLLKECRRCTRPDSGAIRVIVPNAGMLLNGYVSSFRPGLMKEYTDEFLRDAGLVLLGDFDGINPNAAATPVACQKLWSHLMDGHASIYDLRALHCALTEAGWVPSEASFRQTSVPVIQQVLREGVEMQYAAADGHTSLALWMDAVPLVG